MKLSGKGVSRARLALLRERLRDDRSGRVVFVSHCLLNENVRYLGGAFRPGAVEELVRELTARGVGIVQMPCPEQRVWGGVLKRRVLSLHGSEAWLPARGRRTSLRCFMGYSRLRFLLLARLSSAVDCIARCPVAYLDRATYNRDAIAANVVPGRGAFMQALMSGLRRRHLVIPVEEHDLLAEMRERGVGS